jgi:hypothetical protein
LHRWYLLPNCSPANFCGKGTPAFVVPIKLKFKYNIMSVFFRKLRINESTGTATIIATDKPITSKSTTLAGMNVALRTQGSVNFGVLSLIDPETNQVMKANHPTIAALQKKLNAGDEMPGFQLSSNPVVDIQTGEPTTLMWIEAV